jgi:hypothetical protein
VVINPSPRLLILDRLEIARRDKAKPGAIFISAGNNRNSQLVDVGAEDLSNVRSTFRRRNSWRRRAYALAVRRERKGDIVPRLEAPIDDAARRLDVNGFVGLLLNLLIRVMRRPRAGLCHDHFTLGKEV